MYWKTSCRSSQSQQIHLTEYFVIQLLSNELNWAKIASALILPITSLYTYDSETGKKDLQFEILESWFKKNLFNFQYHNYNKILKLNCLMLNFILRHITVEISTNLALTAFSLIPWNSFTNSYLYCVTIST